MSAATDTGMPRYSRRDMTYLINNIARKIADENNGKIDDVFRIEILLKQALIQNPERIDLDKYVKDCRKQWEKINHEVLIPEGVASVRFVPGAFLVVGRRARVMMKKASVADVVAWHQVDDEARKNFLATIAKRDDYRNQRLREFSKNRECDYLGDIEAKLHGYVETPGDETNHLNPFPPPPGEDGSDRHPDL